MAIDPGCWLRVCFALPFAAWIQMSDAASMDMLQRSVLQGDWEAAEQEIVTLRGQYNVDPIELDFLAAFVAAGQRQLPRAIAIYRGILTRRPELHRVRLELARLLFLEGDDEAAQHHFELVRAADIPDQVARNIDLFLNAMRRRRNWSMDFSFGLAPDSNINTGTRNDTVTIAGLPFQLSSDAQETSGVGLLLSLSGSKTFRINGEWSVRFAASGTRKDYRNSRFDDMNLRGTLAVVRMGDWGEFSVAPVTSVRYFGNDTYTRSVGMRSDLSWILTPTQSVQVSFEHLTNRFPTDVRRNGSSNYLQIGQRVLLGPTSSFYAGIDIYDEHARDDAFDNFAVGVTGSYTREFGLGITTELSGRLSSTAYDAVDPLFGVQRSDELYSISLSLSKRDWAILGFSPVFSYTFIRNRSSIDLYDYDRHQYLLAFQRQL